MTEPSTTTNTPTLVLDISRVGSPGATVTRESVMGAALEKPPTMTAVDKTRETLMACTVPQSLPSTAQTDQAETTQNETKVPSRVSDYVSFTDFDQLNAFYASRGQEA
jgi:hypothetical protein